MIKDMDRAPRLGLTKPFTKAAGKTTSHMVKESLRIPRETIMRESGVSQKRKDRANS